MTLWAAEDGWPYPDALGDFIDLAGEADDDLLSVTVDTHLLDSLDPIEREVVSAQFGLRGHALRTVAQLHDDLGLSDDRIESALGTGLEKLRIHLSA